MQRHRVCSPLWQVPYSALLTARGVRRIFLHSHFESSEFEIARRQVESLEERRAFSWNGLELCAGTLRKQHSLRIRSEWHSEIKILKIVMKYSNIIKAGT